MPEAGLIKRAQKGDEDALSEIFREYRGAISYSSRRYFLKGGEREDIVQEGMIGLLRAIKAYDDTRAASFNTFATLCIRRQMINAIQTSYSSKNKIFNEAGSNFLEVGEEDIYYSRRSLNYYSPEEIFLGKEKVGELKKYMERNLSKMEREVFDYMLVGDTYVEISERTGRSIKTIDNTIQRVRKKVKSFSDEYEMARSGSDL